MRTPENQQECSHHKGSLITADKERAGHQGLKFNSGGDPEVTVRTWVEWVRAGGECGGRRRGGVTTVRRSRPVTSFRVIGGCRAPGSRKGRVTSDNNRYGQKSQDL